MHISYSRKINTHIGRSATQSAQWLRPKPRADAKDSFLFLSLFFFRTFSTYFVVYL